MYSNAAAVARPDLSVTILEGAPDPADFIADRVLPVLNSDEQSGQYPILPMMTSQAFKDAATARESNGAYGQIKRGYKWGNFDCVDYGLEEPIDDKDARNISRFFAMEQASAALCFGNCLISREIRTAAAIMSASTFTATAAGVACTETLIATVNYVKDIQSARRRLAQKGIRLNTIVMDEVLFDQMMRSTLFQNFMRGNRPSDILAVYPEQTVAAALGVNQVLIGRAGYDTAPTGKTTTLSSVWGTTYYWCGEVDAGGTIVGGRVLNAFRGAGRTIVWVKEGGLWVTETYRKEDIRSDVVRVRQDVVEKIFNSKAGELITTSYSAS